MNYLQWLRRLRSKMTLTYTLVTGSVFVILWGGLLLLLLSLTEVPAGSPASASLYRVVVNETAVYLQQDPIDIHGLQTYLDLWVSGDTLRVEDESGIFVASYNELRFVAVTDLTGEVLAVEPQYLPLGSIETQIPPEIVPLYQQARDTGEAYYGVETSLQNDPVFFQIIPIEQDQERLGVLLVVHGIEAIDHSFRDEFSRIWLALTATVLCGTLLMGTLFGWLASRGLVKRLTQLELTTEAWADGDFEQRVQDSSGDEIGQLGRHLNQMAERLRDLIVTQSALATVEERNRLARDLHDTAKQQLFAANMQLASARSILNVDPERADQLLGEAERLNELVHTELDTLIQALRPAALQGQGLRQAIEQYSHDWSRNTEITVEVAVQNERPLPIHIEQSLYRVLQEGLANVVKHAQATHVIVLLNYQPEMVTLRIQDNGIGFLPNEAPKGVGLASMNERLSLLNGLLVVDSQPGRGTEITAIVENPYDG